MMFKERERNIFAKFKQTTTIDKIQNSILVYYIFTLYNVHMN